MTGARTIYIIDDDEAMRDSLRTLLQVSGFVPIEFASGESFAAALPALNEGCALIDVVMPGMSGLELLATVKRLANWLPCVMLTGSGDVALAVKAMKLGALDFIEKPFDNDTLVKVLERGLASETSHRLNAHLIPASRLSRLTNRERDVFLGLARGSQNKAIAHELGISVRTVEIHRARVMTKLEAANLADVVRLAISAGVLES